MIRAATALLTTKTNAKSALKSLRQSMLLDLQKSFVPQSELFVETPGRTFVLSITPRFMHQLKAYLKTADGIPMIQVTTGLSVNVHHWSCDGSIWCDAQVGIGKHHVHPTFAELRESLQEILGLFQHLTHININNLHPACPYKTTISRNEVPWNEFKPGKPKRRHATQVVCKELRDNSCQPLNIEHFASDLAGVVDIVLETMCGRPQIKSLSLTESTAKWDKRTDRAFAPIRSNGSLIKVLGRGQRPYDI